MAFKINKLFWYEITSVQKSVTFRTCLRHLAIKKIFCINNKHEICFLSSPYGVQYPSILLLHFLSIYDTTLLIYSIVTPLEESTPLQEHLFCFDQKSITVRFVFFLSKAFYIHLHVLLALYFMK